MDPLLLPAFRFEISLIPSPNTGAEDKDSSKLILNGGFQECSGLEIEMDIQEYLEGGRNNGVVRRAGRARYQPIVLKRGMFFDASANGSSANENKCNADLWRWMQSVIDGERRIARYDGFIYVKSQDNVVRATWAFERGLPAKVKGPELNGKGGELAIEELHIAHESLRLLMPDGAGA